MPRKEVHDAFESLILGKITGMTDLMDAPVSFLHGHHQKIFHSLPELIPLAMSLGGNFIENIMAGLLHIILDQTMTKGKFLMKKNNKKEIEKLKQQIQKGLGFFNL